MADETQAVRRALSVVFAELLDGSAMEAGWVLNPKDPGLLRSLDKLSAAAASAPASAGGPSVAAHVDHLRYGLSLLIRWSQGEDPFAAADYAASWERSVVSDDEWRSLLDQLRANAHAWLETLQEPRVVDESELTGLVASVAHFAYHVGAIRQIGRPARGPSARD